MVSVPSACAVIPSVSRAGAAIGASLTAGVGTGAGASLASFILFVVIPDVGWTSTEPSRSFAAFGSIFGASSTALIIGAPILTTERRAVGTGVSSSRMLSSLPKKSEIRSPPTASPSVCPALTTALPPSSETLSSGSNGPMTIILGFPSNCRVRVNDQVP